MGFFLSIPGDSVPVSGASSGEHKHQKNVQISSRFRQFSAETWNLEIKVIDLR